MFHQSAILNEIKVLVYAFDRIEMCQQTHWTIQSDLDPSALTTDNNYFVSYQTKVLHFGLKLINSNLIDTFFNCVFDHVRVEIDTMIKLLLPTPKPAELDAVVNAVDEIADVCTRN
jgi:hypothetical protein